MRFVEEGVGVESQTNVSSRTNPNLIRVEGTAVAVVVRVGSGCLGELTGVSMFWSMYRMPLNSDDGGRYGLNCRGFCCELTNGL